MAEGARGKSSLGEGPFPNCAFDIVARCLDQTVAITEHASFGASNINREQGSPTMLGTILLIILVLLVIGALPSWPYSRGWGYYPTGGLGLALIIVIILVLIGRI